MIALFLRRSLPLLVPVAALLAACGPVDHRALHRLACQQASGSLDMASVGQLDTLRKALGVAPGVDPIAYCKSLGVTMEGSAPAAPQGEAPDER